MLDFVALSKSTRTHIFEIGADTTRLVPRPQFKIDELLANVNALGGSLVKQCQSFQRLTPIHARHNYSIIGH